MALVLPNFAKLINDSTALYRGLLTDLHTVVQKTEKEEAEIHLHL
jgi:hypothetical protein